MQQLALELTLPPAPSLDNFASGVNSEALTALRAWVSGDLDERSIYLWGHRGCGKSHLLRAIVGSIKRQQQSAAYCRGSDIARVDEMTQPPEWIALDDAHEMDACAQAAAFRMLQSLRETRMRLLVAGDAPPAALCLREDVRTRLAAGLVFQLHVLSDVQKAEALVGHARARGFSFAPELAEYLLRHGPRDLSSLIALLDAADRYSLQTKRLVTLPLLREILQRVAAAPKTGSALA